MIRPFLQIHPTLNETNFVAPSADVIGDVTLGENTSVWYNVTIRGDVHRIRIGANSNVQDNVCIHVTHGTGPTIIGDYVTIGHSAIIHACTIEDNVLVGMGACILDGAVIGENSIIGAKALVTGNTVIPPNSMVLGMPAKVVRQLTEQEIAGIHENAENYVRYSAIYLGKEEPAENPFYDINS